MADRRRPDRPVGHRIIRLADCTHAEVRVLARDPRAVVLLPLGAIEQHGPHLPLSVDWLGAEEIARRIAPHLSRGGHRPVLAPSIPYGVSTLAIGWSGTVSLSPPTLRRLVVEIVEALADHGFRRFVLTNYQADPDHLRVLGRIVRDLDRGRRVQVLVAGFAPGAPPENAMANPRVRALMRSPAPEFEWHSGEVETAVMLSVAPRLVRRDLARRLPPVRVDFPGALRRGVKNFRQMHPGDGYFGSPAVARAETGRRVMTLRAHLIARELLSALDAWCPRARLDPTTRSDLGVHRLEALSARGLRQSAVRGPEFDLITGLVPKPDRGGQVNGIRTPQRVLANQPRCGSERHRVDGDVIVGEPVGLERRRAAAEVSLRERAFATFAGQGGVRLTMTLESAYVTDGSRR